MAYDVYLICFMGETQPIEVVKEIWTEHFHLSDPEFSDIPRDTVEAVLIAAGRTNGILTIKKVYSQIREKTDSDFRCLIVPVTRPFYGFNRGDLWEWLDKVTD